MFTVGASIGALNTNQTKGPSEKPFSLWNQWRKTHCETSTNSSTSKEKVAGERRRARDAPHRAGDLTQRGHNWTCTHSIGLEHPRICDVPSLKHTNLLATCWARACVRLFIFVSCTYDTLSRITLLMLLGSYDLSSLNMCHRRPSAVIGQLASCSGPDERGTVHGSRSVCAPRCP